MSSNDHLEYYRKRARRERELAEGASDPRAAEVHAALATQYEAVVAKGESPSARVLKPNFQKRGGVARRRSQNGDTVKIEG